MAKRAPRKKVTRRLKRSVRKSLAAVLMITAIVVAAIPVPETAAADENAGRASTVRSENVKYEIVDADKLGDSDLVENQLNPLKSHDETTDKKAKSVSLVNNGWLYQNAFYYYTDSKKGNTVLTKYIGTFAEGRVDLKNNGMALDYVLVEEADYNSWHNDLVSSNGSWTMSAPDDTSPDASNIQKYFPQDFEKYKEDYKKDNTLKLVKFIRDLTSVRDEQGDELALTYYCDSKLGLPGYKLQSCSQEQTIGEQKTVYIPRTIDGKTAGNDKTDSNGFKVKVAANNILAIAPEAFKGVTNLKELILPETVRYIGDSAFEGATSISELSGLANLHGIGNYAFKGCTNLTKIEALTALRTVGAEAFSGTSLQSVEFGSTIKKISAGAFADNRMLTEIKFPGNTTTEKLDIEKFAFFDCDKLGKFEWGNTGANVKKIGEGAFAFSQRASGAMTEFTFPSPSAGTLGLENFILANRTGLENVIMPSASITNLNPQEDTDKVPQYTFLNCEGLGCVEFPANANSYAVKDIGYPETLFNEVTNPKFYVKGPKYKSASNDPALSRTSTWDAVCVGPPNTIPYMYTDAKGSFYEICQDPKLLLVDEQGTLQSYTDRPDKQGTVDNSEIVIPAYAGDVEIKAIASDCFNETDGTGGTIKDNVRKITFDPACKVNEIGDKVFQGCKKLESVVISGAVSKIGAEAFADCGYDSKTGQLEVTFEEPNEFNPSRNVELGSNAFTTGGRPLIFRGTINNTYGPYRYAIAKDTFANPSSQLRVCYRAISPYNMTVIVDNKTGEPTLIDYPFFKDVDKDNKEFCKKMEDQWLAYYANEKFDYLRKDKPGEGPWTPDYYTKNPYRLSEVYENSISANNVTEENQFQYTTAECNEVFDKIFHINVPEGIESIDVLSFFKADENNPNIAEYKAYFPKMGDFLSGGNDSVPGLFSGNFIETAAGEKETRGNDYIQSVTLNSVKRLPDYAFDSCENLEWVNIGNACEDLGTAPFRGCDKINDFTDTAKFTTDGTGIIYSTNESGHKTIETCLPTRGLKVNGETVGSRSLNVKTDPTLKDVNLIKPGAFESCNGIQSVDLDGADLLMTIPPYCFRGCKGLTLLQLPDNIKAIEEEAFQDVGTLEAYIYGKEVSIRNNAFMHGEEMGTMHSLLNSAAQRYANTYGIPFEALNDNAWEVIFMDYDGTYLGELQYIENGKPASVPDNPIREGYTFTGWSPTVPDMSTQKITADVTFIAQYKANANSGGSGDGSGDKPPSTDGTTNKPNDDKKDGIYTVTVINGSGSGSYQKGKEVSITANAPSTGRKFDRWETSSLNVSLKDVKATTTTFSMPDNNVVVTAVYDGGNGSSDSDEKDKGNSSGSDGTTNDTANNGNTGTDNAGTGTGNGTSGTGTTTETTPGTTGSGTIVSIPNGIGISNTGAASATVEGSTDNFVVRITTTPYATAAVEKALTNEFGTLDNIRYYPMDISLYDSTGTTPITDTTGLAVNITIPLPDDLIPYAGNNKAGAVVNGDTLEKLGATFKTIDGVPCINFTATHFSPYTIYVDTQNLTAAMDSSPKTGDLIHPKWFLALGLACLSVVLFMKKDKRSARLA